LPELKKTRAHNNLEWSDYDNGKEKKTWMTVVTHNHSRFN
jgi:hypothetical protein